MFQKTVIAPVFLEVALKAGIWAGDVAPVEFFGPVNFTKLEITPAKQETIRILSNMLGSIGEALGSQNKASDPSSMSADINTFNYDLANVILAADTTTVTQAATVKTAQPVTTVLNMWVPLPDAMISATGFTLTTAADAAVAASNYEVDVVNGMIKATAAAAVGTGMKAGYTLQLLNTTTFNAGKVKTTNLKLIGTALDKESGVYGRIQIHKAVVTSDQAIDIAVGGYVSGTLSGDLVTPIGAASPWSFTPLR